MKRNIEVDFDSILEFDSTLAERKGLVNKILYDIAEDGDYECIVCDIIDDLLQHELEHEKKENVIDACNTILNLLKGEI